VACQDEATFGLLPAISAGWARRGSRPVAKTNHACKCINVFGARSKTAFVFSFSKKKSGRRFVRFLGLLVARWNRVCLFVDNAPWHRGPVVKEFCRRHRKTFRLVYFPKYSPELNPVEPCWKPGRKALSNRVVRSIASARYRLYKTFNNRFLLPKMFGYFSD